MPMTTAIFVDVEETLEKLQLTELSNTIQFDCNTSNYYACKLNHVLPIIWKLFYQVQ